MNTGNINPIAVDEDSLFTQSYSCHSLKLVFDSAKIKDYFSPFNDSNKFGTVDYDAYIKFKIDYSTKHVLKWKTIQELNALHHVWELERTQFLYIEAICVQNLPLAGYVLTGNRINFVSVDGSTVWLCDCPPFFPHLYETDKKSIDCIPIYYQDTVIYIDLRTRQTFVCTTCKCCDNNPQKVIA